MHSNVLITGAAGFVGQALVKALWRHDTNRTARVVAMVRDKHRPLDFGDSTVYGNITDRDFCQRALADYEIDTVYHLAAQAIVSACAEDPLSALEIGVMGTARLLQAVRDAGRPVTVIVSTSDKVYGSSPSPYTESTPLDARHAYEVSKACQDLVARMYHSNYDVDVRVVRAVNIYGPGDPNETRLVPQTVLRCLRGERPLVHAGASDMRRQYVYIDDLVSALRLVREAGAPGEAYCVGSLSPPVSVRDVVREIALQTGQHNVNAVEVKARDSRFREIQEQANDDRKLRALGWQPEVAFADGVARTIAWYREKGRGSHVTRP